MWGEPSKGCLCNEENIEDEKNYQNFFNPQLVTSLLNKKVLEVGCGDKFTVVICKVKTHRYSKSLDDVKKTVYKDAKRQI